MHASVQSYSSWTVANSEIHLDNYKLYRNDRKSGRGGGILLYIHCSLTFMPCVALNEFGIEDSMWGSIELTDEKLLIGIVYRPPSSSICTNENSYTKLSSFTQLLLMGDFNYLELDWSSLTVSGGDSTPAAAFLNTCEDTFLVQHVQNPQDYGAINIHHCWIWFLRRILKL